MLGRVTPALALAGALALGACSDDGPEPTAPAAQPIAAVAVAAGLTELVDALGYVDEELGTGLVQLFTTGAGPFTVLAPTDAAFDGLYELLGTVLGAPIDDVRDLPAPVVRDVLLHHVVEGRRTAGDVVPAGGERQLTPLSGEALAVRADGSIRDGLTGVRPDARIVSADVAASNGVIHVIDAVIVPPSVVAALGR